MIAYLERHGRPVAFYADQAGPFVQETRSASKGPMEEREAKLTESIIRRGLRELNVEPNALPRKEPLSNTGAERRYHAESIHAQGPHWPRPKAPPPGGALELRAAEEAEGEDKEEDHDILSPRPDHLGATARSVEGRTTSPRIGEGDINLRSLPPVGHF